MTEQQRKNQLEKLVKEITSLQNAMKAKDPSMTRNVYLDKDLNWLCEKSGPYAKECETMRQQAVTICQIGQVVGTCESVLPGMIWS